VVSVAQEFNRMLWPWNSDSIAEPGGSVVLPRLIQQLRDDSRLFRQHSPLHRQTDKHFEHSVIIRALRNKDVEGGRWAMRAVMGSVGPILRRLPDAVAFGFRHQSLRVLGKQARAGRQRQPDANTDAIARPPGGANSATEHLSMLVTSQLRSVSEVFNRAT